MARIQYSALVNGIKGKMSGTTFKTGASGAHVIQSKSNRRNANTNNAQPFATALTAKNATVTTAKHWRELTDAQRQTWVTGTVNFPYVDHWGQTRTRSGYGFYLKTNNLLRMLGIAVLDNCPVPATYLTTGPIAVAITLITFLLKYNQANPIAAGTHTVLMATRPITDGRKAISSDYKIIKVLAPADMLPFDIGTTYEAVFGTRLTGNQAYFSAYTIVDTTGQVSIKNYIRANIA